MEIPTAKTFPYVVIFAMGTTILSLATYIVAREQQCAEERKTSQTKLEACQGEIREVYHRQNVYLQVQDSINRAQARALAKVIKK